MNDPLYEACESFLSNRHTVLWSDYDLTRPDRKEKAARWLAAQIQGVAEHYDAAPTAPPFFTAGTADTKPLTDAPNEHYEGPYSHERNGGGRRPSALVTHGQQPERW